MDASIFREYDIRGLVGSQLNADTVPIISRAIATYLSQHGAKRIAVGFDFRTSSPEFASILTRELNAAGCDVVSIGMVPTPVLYYTVHTRDVDGGVMITGSHNPADHNGFKISLGKRSLSSSEIQKVRTLTEQAETSRRVGIASVPVGANYDLDVLDDYCQDTISHIKLSDRKLRVVIDAGNGSGGITAVPVYKNLGIDLVELYTTPDGTVPHHPADPSQVENLQDLIAAVREHKADVGFAFDGDGDRLGVVDETGEIWWGDKVLTLFARDVLKNNPGGTVVAEAKCSQTLFDDIEKHGGKSVMAKAGHSIIKAKMQEVGAVLGGEMSAHFFFADRHFGYDDAAYAGARLLEILSNTDKPLSKLLADLPVTFSTPEIRVACPEDKKFHIVDCVVEHFSRDHKVITVDGARIIFDDGRGIVRASNTQAMLVLRFEAETESALAAIRSEVELFLKSYLQT